MHYTYNEKKEKGIVIDLPNKKCIRNLLGILEMDNIEQKKKGELHKNKKTSRNQFLQQKSHWRKDTCASSL